MIARGHFDPCAVANRQVAFAQAALPALGFHGDLLASQSHRRLCPGRGGMRGNVNG